MLFSLQYAIHADIPLLFYLIISSDSFVRYAYMIVQLHHFFVSVVRRIKEIVVQNKGNTVLELQQRSIEFNSIIQRHQSIR
jgi:hypothetical protein